MNTMNNSVKVNVVIISSYKYDDSHIDDNRAWYTVYELFFPENKKIVSVTESTGFGEDIFKDKNYNIVKATPEILEEYKTILNVNRINEANHLLEKYKKELEEYNKICRPQEKGQVVEVMGGRRKGVIAKISWLGKGKKFGFDVDRWYRKAYPMAAAFLDCINYRPYTIPAQNFDLIRVWPIDGSAPFYINIDKVKVIEGYKEITISEEECDRFNRSFLADFSKKWNNGYDHKSILD